MICGLWLWMLSLLCLLPYYTTVSSCPAVVGAVWCVCLLLHTLLKCPTLWQKSRFNHKCAGDWLQSLLVCSYITAWVWWLSGLWYGLLRLVVSYVYNNLCSTIVGYHWVIFLCSLPTQTIGNCCGYGKIRLLQQVFHCVPSLSSSIIWSWNCIFLQPNFGAKFACLGKFPPWY